MTTRNERDGKFAQVVIAKDISRCFPLAGVALALAICLPGNLSAQMRSIPQEKHVWGRFSPGSWSQVRKQTEELDKLGNVEQASVTETRTTLLERDDQGCTLQLEVTVEVAGKRFAAPAREIRLGFNGEVNDQAAVIRQVGSAPFLLGDNRIECQLLESTVQEGDDRIVSKILYSPNIPPFVLRRVTETLDAEGNSLGQQAVVEVVALDMPQKVLAETKSAAHMRTTKTGPAGKTCTMEILCMDVPGGVVSQASKEMDASGRVVQRSTLELLDYGVMDETRLLGRGRIFSRRARRVTIQVDPKD